MYHIIDLHFMEYKHAIASFLIESTEGPILVETGPYSTFEHLKAGLKRHRYEPEDIRHVFLSHIHFDHAGAAWTFARNDANIYLHPFGVNHMHNPDRLVASATMIYGDQMDTLWGKMERIRRENLIVCEHDQIIEIGDQTIRSLHTPGHAKHHTAWQWQDIIFTGDTAGVKIEGGPVVPPCPPPDISLEDWMNSIDIILSKKPNALVLTHYGEVQNPTIHLQELKEILYDWAYWIKEKWEGGLSNEQITPLFVRYIAKQLKDKGVSDLGIKQYEVANPSWMSVAGLVRYWKKKLA